MIDTAHLLYDWIGDGKTVTQTHADARASVCMVCPKNVEALWWEKMIKDPIAEVIRHQLEIKNGMQLHADGEAFLSMCSCCGCAVSLKVWVPIDHIKAHTAQDVYTKFPAFCWIRNEIDDATEVQ